MSRRLLAVALAALALPLQALALEDLIVQKIQFRIDRARAADGSTDHLVDPVQAAFDRLEAAAVLRADGAAGDPVLAITQRVLAADDPELAEPLATLVTSGVLSGLLPDSLLPDMSQVAPKPGPSAGDQQALRAAARHLDRCQDALGEVAPLVDEFNNAFFGRKKVMLKINAAITRAADLLSRAADELKRVKDRRGELFEATRRRVLEVHRLVEARLEWWKRTVDGYNAS